MELLSPQTTLAILLGASEWPNWPGLASGKPFANAGAEMRKYLLDENAFTLPKENLLDLFDSEDPVSIVDRKISEFLKKRRDVAPQNVLLYYVGHGGFLGGAKDYYLALRSSIEDIGSSVLRMQDLASTVKACAPDLRRYVILDCCFAARAFQEFQSSAPVVVAREKTLDAFPNKGTALLCSSSARDPSIAPAKAPSTMFTGSLLRVLREGSGKYPPGLSLNEVGEMVEQLVKETYADEGVRPQVLSPNQDEGNIAKLPLFPNPAHRLSAVDQRLAAQDDRLGRIEASIRSLAEQAASVAKSAVNPTSAEPQELSVHWGASDRYGLSHYEWESIPGDVRQEVLRYYQARLIGAVWCVITLICAVAAVIALVADMSSGGSSISSATTDAPAQAAPSSSFFSSSDALLVFGRISWAGVVAMGFLSLLAFTTSLLAERLHMSWSSATPSAGAFVSLPWENFDAVIVAKRAKLFKVVGSMYIASPFLEISLLTSVALVGVAVLLGETQWLYRAR